MKFKRTMLYTLTGIGLMVMLLIIAKRISIRQFDKEVKLLFAQSKEISGRTFNYQQLAGLPEPVQRYFRLVLKEGQPYVRYVRLIHNGKFKTDKNKGWIDIKGEQYFTCEKPGFIWEGRTSMFTARDMYIEDKGRLDVFLFGLFKITGGEGEKYDHGELLRWLGESVWFPTNLLPNDNLQWTAIDSRTALLNFQYLQFSLQYQISFNNFGEITELKTKRYMGDGNLETWLGRVSRYKEMNGMLIPTKIEATYVLPEGDYSYAQFNIQKIEYNVPDTF